MSAWRKGKKNKYLVIDAHEDMAENMLTFGRDYTRPVAETRELEKKSKTVERNGNTLLGWDAYQEGQVCVIFSTFFAAPERFKLGDWDLACYSNRDEAHNLYVKQLEIYQEMTRNHPDKFQTITNKTQLHTHLKAWEGKFLSDDSTSMEKQPAIGLVYLIEGGEGIRHPKELELWWDYGVRIIGPAWGGTCFCGGTDEPGPLTEEGYELLTSMAEFGFGLDISHMDEKAALQAIDHYPKTILASHANAKVLLPNTKSNRFLSEEVISALMKRNGVVGVVPYNPFLMDGWKEGDDRELVPFSSIVDQIDYYCQFAGNSNHVGIGTDFDGGFGLESTPSGVDSIADLQKLAPLLSGLGYSETDIENIFYKNWLRCLEQILPEN